MIEMHTLLKVLWRSSCLSEEDRGEGEFEVVHSGMKF